jgi:hypothetical protein
MVWSSPLPDIQSVSAEPSKETSSLPQRAACEAANPPFDASDRVAVSLRGFGPLGILAILIILGGNELFVPLSAILVLVWVRLSRTPWREIGYVRPSSWIGSVIVGIVCGVTFKFATKAIVMPLLGAPPLNQAYLSWLETATHSQECYTL